MDKLWFKRSLGLNVVVDPVRLEYNPETGIQILATSYNVDHDYTGRISRRRGWEATSVTTAAHSLFTFGDHCLFVTGTSLCRLGTDYSYSLVATLGNSNPVSYCGLADKIYWSNGVDKGFIQGLTNFAWTLPANIRGRETTRQYGSPPPGDIVRIFNGRIYICQGSVAWYTEPYGFNMVDYTRDFLAFESGIRIFHPVKEGIYVGTGNGVWFLRGGNPKDFVWERVQLDPPIKGSEVEIDTAMTVDINKLVDSDAVNEGIGLIWTGKEGVCIGSNNGRVVNITRRKLNFLGSTSAAAILMDDRYICCLHNTPRGPLTLAVNVETFAPGQYLNYNFDSFCKFGDVYLGANSSGIFTLDVADKDGTSEIHALIKLPPTDFGFKGTKTIRYIEFSYETDGNLKVIPFADEVQGESYELLPRESPDTNLMILSQKIPIGKYLRGRKFGLTVENIKGSDFSLDEITVQLAGLRPA